ncbi:hypothetical protein FB451DRAFT_1392041 [Mycena latifolia]|nr:hypothetical protein FB451DRAFT_1392041 [Mycena latifolia]
MPGARALSRAALALLHRFIDEIERCGFISKNLYHSQPPLSSQMLARYFTASNGIAILACAAPLAEVIRCRASSTNHTVGVRSPFTNKTPTIA